MRQVLFVAYDFPPARNVGGSLRSEKFVQYLPEFGWEPTVVALQNDSLQSERFPNVIRLASLTPWEKPYQMKPIGWTLALHSLLKRILAKNTYDLIYVSCPPFPHSLIAALLGKAFDIPVVVDFRDAWSLDPYVEGSLLKKVVNRLLYPFLERRTLAATDLLLVNTPSAVAAYIDRYPALKGRIRMLPNGFDEADFPERGEDVPNKTPYTLLYCGRFGIGARDPIVLLQALKIVRATNVNIQLRILGDNSPTVWEQVKALGLQDAVSLHEQVQHREAIRALYDAHALVLYQQPSRSRITAVAGKTHEYLRVGKPILAIAPEGDNLRIIRQFSPVSRCVTSYQPEEIAHAMLELQVLFAREQTVLSQPSPRYINYFNRRALTARLAKHFLMTVKKGAQIC